VHLAAPPGSAGSPSQSPLCALSHIPTGRLNQTIGHAGRARVRLWRQRFDVFLRQVCTVALSFCGRSPRLLRCGAASLPTIAFPCRKCIAALAPPVIVALRRGSHLAGALSAPDELRPVSFKDANMLCIRTLFATALRDACPPAGIA